jgi:UDPglucose 6-dehydrogenase
VEQADVVALLTEWEEFRTADPDHLGVLVSHRRIVDGRHALDPERYTSRGWEYRALGRPYKANTESAFAPTQHSAA